MAGNSDCAKTSCQGNEGQGNGEQISELIPMTTIPPTSSPCVVRPTSSQTIPVAGHFLIENASIFPRNFDQFGLVWTDYDLFDFYFFGKENSTSNEHKLYEYGDDVEIVPTNRWRGLRTRLRHDKRSEAGGNKGILKVLKGSKGKISNLFLFFNRRPRSRGMDNEETRFNIQIRGRRWGDWHWSFANSVAGRVAAAGLALARHSRAPVQNEEDYWGKSTLTYYTPETTLLQCGREMPVHLIRPR